jgi:hypothetical protein
MRRFGADAPLILIKADCLALGDVSAWRATALRRAILAAAQT